MNTLESNNNSPPSLGGAIRLARRRKKITQTELARRLGITYRQVLRYERGDAKTPSPETAKALKRVLGIDADEYAPKPPGPEDLHREIGRQRAEIRRLRQDLEVLAEIVRDRPPS